MFVNGGGKYEVKLVNPNSSSDETIKEIAFALDHLTSISSKIFESLNGRLKEQRGQLTSLTNRLTAAADQVTTIQKSQKAIRVISPAKYPTEVDGELSFPPLLSDPVNLQLRVPPRSAVLRFEAPIKHPDDLLACFHVKDTQFLTETVQEMGLGKAPTGLDTIDSFLVFNDAQNPYKHYRVKGKGLTGGGSVKHARKSGEVLEGSVQPLQLADKIDVKDDFYYSPSTLQIPDINVPEHLPDLPGVVDSLDQSLGDTLPFNMFTFQQRNPLPLELIPSISDDSSCLVPSNPPPFIPAVPSPPVMPTPTPLPLNVVQTMPPPPPPPMPPKEIETYELPPPKKINLVGNSRSGEVHDRTNLMAAIREAGGAGKAILSSAKDRKYEAKKKKQEEKEKNVNLETSDGLMSDLKNTLAMRRKGISGIQGGGNRTPGLSDLMQTLVSTIPKLEESGDSTRVGAGGDSLDSDNDDWD